MTVFEKIKFIYFLGIGGIGMSALARYFKAAGKEVAGYDRTPTSLTGDLIKEGIAVSFEEEAGHLPAALVNLLNSDPSSALLVYTPAIPSAHRQLAYFREKGYSLKKRSEVLGIIAANSYCVAVAGTHGKTTTSSMVTHLVKSSGRECTAFLGGIAKNYNSNFIIGRKEQGQKEIMVVEADEFDRSFLTLFPDIALITSMDADHLDIYGSKEQMQESYRRFASQVKPGGTLLVRKGLDPERRDFKTYSIKENADYFASNIRVSDDSYVFDFHYPGGQMSDISVGLPGIHNVENATGAAAVALQLNIGEAVIRRGLQTYSGVKRRFEYIIKKPGMIFIDDYAHHPEELRACITSVRQLYGDKKITGVFQPHLFSRTRDFAGEFAESLSLLDEVLLLDIYPAREQPLEGVTSQIILNKIKSKSKRIVSGEELRETIKKENVEVLVTLGAGDIDKLVEPLKKILEEKTR